MPLTFTAVSGGTGLFRLTPATGPVVLYYQSLASTAPSPSDPSALWTSDPGVWFFAPAATSISDPASLGTRLKLAIQALPGHPGLDGNGAPLGDSRWIAWLSDPNAPQASSAAPTCDPTQPPGTQPLACQLQTQYVGKTQIGSLLVVQHQTAASELLSSTSIRFGTMLVHLPPQSTVGFDLASGVFKVTGKGPGQGPALQQVSSRGIEATLFIPSQQVQGSVEIGFTGGDTGRLLFDMDSQGQGPGPNRFFRLISLSGRAATVPEFLYVVGSGGGQKTLRFPMPLDPAPTDVFLNAALDPLNPFDTSRTVFAFDASKYTGGVPASNSFRTPLGNEVILTPQANAGGYGLGKGETVAALGPEPEGGYQPYLTPGGLWTVTVAGGASTGVQVMCGLGGTEFLLVKSGDTLEFVGGQPAAAPSFETAQPAPSDLVGTTFTTSWVKVLSSAPAGLIPSYCVQPQDSVYFGAGQASEPPTAVGCRMANLADAATTNPVPMVPYSSIYTDVGFGNPNPGVGTSIFAAFERLVVAPHRRAGFRPKFDYEVGPRYFDLEGNKPLLTGTMRTARGFLAMLNTVTSANDPLAGTVSQLEIAKSPEKSALAATAGKEFLAFQSGGNRACTTQAPNQSVISPCLANALEDDNLFLVAASTDKTPSTQPFGTFANEVSIGEFIFQWDTRAFDATTGDGGAVVVFKFAVGSTVSELVDQADAWDETETFLGADLDTTQKALQIWIAMAGAAATGNDSALETLLHGLTPATQTALNTAYPGIIEAAEAIENEPPGSDTKAYFTDLYAKVTDAQWTGVLAFNTPLPYGQLTSDLQMLLGGIDGRLGGFHFGVTANRITGSPGMGSIENSSLFGLIFHQEALDEGPAKAKPPTTHFQVPVFRALFTNSALSQFEAQVAMTIPELFGDEVALTKGSNEDKLSASGQPAGIVVIDGAYQKDARNGEGAIVFQSTATRTFDLTMLQGSTPGYRALQEVRTDDADLAPVSSVPSGGETTVVATFSLQGALQFNPAVGGSADLFSYGDDLAFTGYPFQMTTVIDGNTATLQGITVDPSAVRLDDTGATLRTNSLIGTLPTQLQAPLRFDTAGISASSQGGWQVLQQSSTDLGTALASAVSPEYALAFTLPIGTLGDLVSAHDKLFATVLLGWTASGADVAGDNEVGLILVLPPQMGGHDGQFPLQGIIETVFKTISLSTYSVPTGASPPSTTLYAFELESVALELFGIPLIESSARALSLFGNPKNPHVLDLLWYLSGLEVSADKSAQSFLSFLPTIGLGAGLDVTLPILSTQVVGPAIAALTNLAEDTQEMVNALADPAMKPDPSPAITPDPDAGVLFFLSLSYKPLSLQVLLDDPSFYGGRLAIGSPEPPKKGEVPKGKPGSDSSEEGKTGSSGSTSNAQDGDSKQKDSGGPLAVLGGLEVEIVYRRINDHLGVWSIDFVLPDKFRKICFGECDNPETIVLTLPEIGIEIYTNGDWEVAIGWPFSNSKTGFALGKQLTLKVPIEGIPILFALGFFIAKLRSEDIGIGNFPLIWEFGVGLAGGPSVEEKAGPIAVSADLYAFVALSGFLASCTGTIPASGADYHWYSIQAGINANITGKLDLKIISATLVVEASIVLTIAFETQHSTHLLVEAQLKVDLSVKIVFFTIRFRFSVDAKLIDATLGTGVPAKLTGPTPPKNFCPPPALQMGTGTSPANSVGAAAATVQLPPKPVAIPIDVAFGVQPTAVLNGSTESQAVVGLVIQAPDQAPPNAGNAFGKLAQNMAAWVINQYQGTFTDAEDLLQNVALKLGDGTFHADALGCLDSSFVFQVEAASTRWTAQTPATVAVLPIFPQLALAYNGASHDFDAAGPVGSSYAEEVQQYFGAGAGTVSTPSTLDTSVAGIAFIDYYVMLAQQVIQEVTSLVAAGDSLTDALANADYGNVAGVVTRFLQHGLRLPYPDPAASDPSLEALFVLTGQQIPIVESSGKPVLAFELATGSTDISSWVKLGGADGKSPISESLDSSLVLDATWDGTPPWHAAAMDPTTSTQQRFVLGTPITNGTNVLRMLPQALLVEIFQRDRQGLATSLTTEVPATSPTAPPNPGPAAAPTAPPKPAPAAAPVLRLPVTVRQVPVPGSPSEFVSNVYQMVGASEADRGLLQALLDAVEAQPATATIDSLSILWSSKPGTLETLPLTTHTVLAKVDLATESALGDLPPMADTCPDSARPDVAAERAAFLRLVWEASIVHRAGFYLYDAALETDKVPFTNNEAQLTLLVGTAAAATTVEVEPFHNALQIAAASNPASVQVAVSGRNKNTTGPDQAVLVYQPNVPAGSAGYRLTWCTPPTAVTAANTTDYLESLYHIVTAKVATTIAGVSNNWSPPVAGHELQPNESLPMVCQGVANAKPWLYRHHTAIYGSGESRYTNVGKTVEFDLSLVDIYGNALPTSLAPPPISTTVVYNDRLVSIDQWQGSHLSYQIGPGAAGKVTLTVALAFTPDTFPATPTDPSQQQAHARQALVIYQRLTDQLEDPNVTLSIQPYFVDANTKEIGLFNSPLIQDDSGTSVEEKLRKSLVQPVVAWLTAVAAGQTPPSPPADFNLELSFDAGYPDTLPVDLFPLTVRVALERKNVESTIAAQIPAAQNVSHEIQPVQDPTAAPSGEALRTFAKAFESAYENYDGEGGILKLAQGRDAATGGAVQNRALFVSRWGRSGLTVALQDQQKPPVYFAPTPLSTQLLTDSFQVRDYKTMWLGTSADYTLTTQRFNQVDLDGWMSELLHSFTEVLSPLNATGIATLGSTLYEPLVAAKRTLAEQLSVNSAGTSRVAQIIEEQAKDGSIADAAQLFEEALLVRLETDYSLSAIVQVPAEVGIGANTVVEDDPVTGNPSALPPVVYGKVIAVGAQGTTGISPYTLSPTALPLATSDEWAEVLVSAKNPGRQEELDLDLQLNISQLEHAFEATETACGYVPSSWLSFVLPPAQDTTGAWIDPATGQPGFLTAPIGKVDIPIPLRSFPPPPALVSQSAEQMTPAGTQDLGDYSNWQYTMTVGRPKAEQDDLLLTVTFNEPVTPPDPPSPGAMTTTDDSRANAPATLFEALARFHAEWPAISTQLPSVEVASQSTSVGMAVVERYQELVNGVTATLPGWENPAPSATASATASMAGGGGSPAIERWTYRVVLFIDDKPTMTVTRSPGQKTTTGLPPWPAIDGYVTPTGTAATQQTATYAISGTANDQVELSWSQLTVLDHQSVRGSAALERNVDIVPQGLTTNPAFVYRTAEVVFPNVLTPFIEDADPVTLPSESTLSAALTNFLGGVFPASESAGQMLHFDLVTGYEYRLVADPTSPTSELVSRGPVFLQQEQIPASMLSGFTSELTNALVTWQGDAKPSEAGGILSFELTLFAADTISQGSLVLVHLADVRIPLPTDPTGWWK